MDTTVDFVFRPIALSTASMTSWAVVHGARWELRSSFFLPGVSTSAPAISLLRISPILEADPGVPVTRSLAAPFFILATQVIVTVTSFSTLPIDFTRSAYLIPSPLTVMVSVGLGFMGATLALDPVLLVHMAILVPQPRLHELRSVRETARCSCPFQVARGVMRAADHQCCSLG